MSEKVVLRNLLKVSLVGIVIFKYKDIVYRTSTPIIEDFKDDKMEILLNKKVDSILPDIIENDVALIIKLLD